MAEKTTNALGVWRNAHEKTTTMTTGRKNGGACWTRDGGTDARKRSPKRYHALALRREYGQRPREGECGGQGQGKESKGEDDQLVRTHFRAIQKFGPVVEVRLAFLKAAR